LIGGHGIYLSSFLPRLRPFTRRNGTTAAIVSTSKIEPRAVINRTSTGPESTSCERMTVEDLLEELRPLPQTARVTLASLTGEFLIDHVTYRHGEAVIEIDRAPLQGQTDGVSGPADPRHDGRRAARRSGS